MDRVEPSEPRPGAEGASRLGEHLRDVRRQQGWSLNEIEVASEGRFKASVLGAYERGDRTVSIERLRQLAEFYRVSVAELLPRGPAREAERPEEGQVVIDLVALERRRHEVPVLSRYVDAIRLRRGDRGGLVLTLRDRDLRGLAAAEGRPEAELAEELRAQGLLR
jgi:transcriptional regulator with XRE-family HTH domain